MNTLINQLIAIKETAKNIHYTCKGENAYSIHLLADRVAENIDGYLDSLKEAILGNDTYPKFAQEYLRDAIILMPDIKIGDNKNNFMKLYTLIDICLKHIDEMQLDKSDESLVTTIGENLKNSKGLINLQIS